VGNKSRHAANRTGAPARSAAARPGRDGGPDDSVERALAELWAAVGAADVLEAEYQTSAVVAVPELTDGRPDEVEQVADALVSAAVEHSPGSDAAAFLRLLASLGPRPVKRAASRGLAELTEDGAYPPSWVTEIGKPTVGRAWRQHDVFGEHEAIVVTFSYADVEHVLVVDVDLAELPTVDEISMGDDPDGLIKALTEEAGPFQRLAEITPAEARRRIGGPLAAAGDDPGLELDESTILLLPLARSRVRRLPAEDPTQLEYTAADRAAAVEEFLRSPEAGEVGDPEVARFWATVLTGYSSRVPDEPPARVGPYTVQAMLLMHAASTFTLTDGQRAGMDQAVTGWTRWAVRRQGLDEAAADQVMASLAEALDAFPDEYDFPDVVASRGYLLDLATPDVDLRWLADQLARRRFAAPLPGEREPSLDGVDATDPRGRAKIALTEFSECADGGADTVQLVTAAARVVEAAWQDNPASTWERAKRLLAEGHDRHDVIHRLAG
jgi:hypothetical protein